MIRKIIFVLIVSLLTGIKTFAQDELKVSIVLLANDKISDVNIVESRFLKGLGDAVKLMRSEFNLISKEQKIAILINCHKVGQPTIEFYSSPQIDLNKELGFVNQLKLIQFENTKIVDFPILLSVNIKPEEINVAFNKIISPVVKTQMEYEKADLKTKYELNKVWAAKVVLPIYCAYQSIVDNQFAGVKNFGKRVEQTDFSLPQNIQDITDKNSDYWRACMEMSIGNELIPETKIFMYMSQGLFDYAKTYFEVVGPLSDGKTKMKSYLNELTWRLELFNKQLNNEIEKGISDHNKGNFQNAIERYNNIIYSYPNSAWAQYEKYYSQKSLDRSIDSSNMGSRENWDNAKKIIYACNPLYSMDVMASTGYESYLLFRRSEIASLFKNKDETLNDIYKYADISMDLKVYDFAAQLFWYSFTYSKNKQKALNRFLYSVDKLGVSNLSQIFKGNFEKEFKKIDLEKEKEMKNSNSFKVMKN